MENCERRRGRGEGRNCKGRQCDHDNAERKHDAGRQMGKRRHRDHRPAIAQITSGRKRAAEAPPEHDDRQFEEDEPGPARQEKTRQSSAFFAVGALKIDRNAGQQTNVARKGA